MGIRLNEKVKQSGSVLFVTLMITAVLGVTLGSYLCWIQHQNTQAARSEAWNSAMALAEAGVEEALAQLNANFGTNYAASTAANWGRRDDGVFGPHANILPAGSYSVIISNDYPPTIYSTGLAKAPALPCPASRTVRVTTTNAAAFSSAMAALQNIEFNGNNIAVDSYDSSQPGVHSTLGGMYDPATRMAGGDVSSTYGTIEIGNANINGKVRTGPLGVAPSVGPSGFVGDLNWTTMGQIQPGWYANDFNMDFADVTLPPNFVLGYAPDNLGTTNKYLLGQGDFTINGNLILNAGEVMYVAGVARLYVTGSVLMKGAGLTSSMIQIGPGAQLQLFVGGGSAALAQVNIDPANCVAGSFQYYGLPGNTGLSWRGNSAYAGTVYAPSAVFALSGSGDPKNPTDFQGSCVVNSVVMNGHFKFHYDENLQRMGPWMGFKAVTWTEL